MDVVRATSSSTSVQHLKPHTHTSGKKATRPKPAITSPLKNNTSSLAAFLAFDEPHHWLIQTLMKTLRDFSPSVILRALPMSG
jgi:hypothetical protein